MHAEPKDDAMTLERFFQVAMAGEPRAIQLLERYPDLARTTARAGDYQEGQPAPAVVHAAHRGLAGLTAELLDHGADIAARGLGGGTALHIAAWMGHAGTVAVLIERGAPVNERCHAIGATPLGWAAHGYGPTGAFPKNDHLGAVKNLLAAGADPEIANYDGNRPIDLVQDPNGNAVQALLELAGGAAAG